MIDHQSKPEEFFTLRGQLEIVKRNLAGQIVDKRVINNTIVTAGRRWVMEAIQSGNNASSQTIGYVAVGTSTTAPATSDTALGSESDRNAITSFTTSNLTSTAPSWRAEASFATNEANTTLGEVALFNSSAAGTMLGRATFSTIDKTTSNTLSVSYTVSN